MRGERGQITLFVAVGLVLLFVVGLVIYTLLRATETPDQAPSVGVLSTFLASCVDTVVREQLLLLGQQGGVLDLAGYPSATVDGKQRLYGITRNMDEENTGAIGPYKHDPPRYPDWDVTIERSSINPETQQPFQPFQDGYFGDVWLPAICEKDGKNNPRGTFSCVYYEGNPPGTPGPSSQGAFADAVLSGVRSCADLDAFSTATGQDVERVDDPAINVTFTTTNVIVTLTYPVVLRGSATARLETFQRDYKVRYLPLARFATELAREETRNVSFDMANDYGRLASYRQGFTILRLPDVPFSSPSPGIASQHATLVTITDAQSPLDGTSFAFSFLVEHRQPMLGPVSSTAWDEFLDGTDVAVSAADPDGSAVSISYCRAEPGSPCDGDTKIVVTDVDGDADWQET